MKKFKYAEIYHGAKKNEKPSLSNKWFVYYYYLVPDSQPQRYIRIVKKGNINKYDTIAERMEYAKRLVRTIDRQLDNGFSPYADKMDRSFITTEDAINFSLSKKQWSSGTWRGQRAVVKLFKKVMGDKMKANVKDFSRADAREMLDKMVAERKVGNSAYNYYKASMHGIFQELVEWEKLDKNAVNPFLFRGRKVIREPRVYPTPEELKAMTEILTDKLPGLLDFYRIMNYTAIRPSEILALQDYNINLKDWEIVLEAKKVKTGEGRVVIIPEDIRKMIKKRTIQGHYLFGKKMQPEARNRPLLYSSVIKHFMKLLKEPLGVKFRPYIFKHMGIESMLGSGMHPKAAQYQAGHSSQVMTDLYSGKKATLFRDQLEKFKGNL